MRAFRSSRARVGFRQHQPAMHDQLQLASELGLDAAPVLDRDSGQGDVMLEFLAQGIGMVDQPVLQLEMQ